VAVSILFYETKNVTQERVFRTGILHSGTYLTTVFLFAIYSRTPGADVDEVR